MRKPRQSRWGLALACATAAVTLIAAPPSAWAEDEEAKTEAAPPYQPQRGVTIGLDLLITSLGTRDTPDASNPDQVLIDDGGGGLVLTVGYTFTENFALQLAMGGSVHNTTLPNQNVNYGTVVLEARYMFTTASRAKPFLFGGLGAATVRFEAEELVSEIEGPVAVMGAGLQVYLARHWRLEVAGRLDLINWDRVSLSRDVNGNVTRLEAPVDENGQAGKIHFGIVWAF